MGKWERKRGLSFSVTFIFKYKQIDVVWIASMQIPYFTTEIHTILHFQVG